MKKWRFGIAIDKSIVVLCIPLFLLAFADYFFTATRQLPEYYASPKIEEKVVNGVKTIEMNKSVAVKEKHPWGKWLLERHILLFVTYSLLWFPLILVAMHIIPGALYKMFKIPPYMPRVLYVVIDIIYFRINAVWNWFSKILRDYFVNFPPETIAQILKTSQILFVLFFSTLTVWAIIKHYAMQLENE